MSANPAEPELEDELGDVLEKAARHHALTHEGVAAAAKVDLNRIKDALDYRSELTSAELGRLARALDLNEVGLTALAQGKYPLPGPVALPFRFFPLRMPFGIGVANAYLVSTGGNRAVLFDTGASHAELHRAWPPEIDELQGVFITHYEAEHVGGLERVLLETGLAAFQGPATRRFERCRAMGEGETVECGGFTITAHSTPGHAAEHNCYRVRLAQPKGGPPAPKGPELLISGDLVFAGSLGGGYFCCQRQLKHSRRILDLVPPDTWLAPGHGPLTTAANEKRFNPFLS
jgi:hydroxyacylglutathione hydrolase